jgi:hypothetical protein
MADQPKRALLFRERPGGEGQWSSWKVAELGVTSLLVKAQDRPQEYEVSEVVEVAKTEGIAVTIDLGRLWNDGNVEDRILGIVARRMIEDVGDEAKHGVDSAVRDVRAEVIREQVEPVVREALTKPMQPTNQYGEVRPGAEPVTLAELIEKEVKRVTTVKDRDVHSGRRGTTGLEQMIEEAVGREFKSELKKAVDGAKAAALDKVREAAGEVIAETVRRAGASL